MGGRQDGHERRFPVAECSDARNRRSDPLPGVVRSPPRRRRAAAGPCHSRTTGPVRRDGESPHRPATRAQQREARSNLLLQGPRAECPDGLRHGGHAIALQPARAASQRGLPRGASPLDARGVGSPHPATGGRFQRLCPRSQVRISEKGPTGAHLLRGVRRVDR